MDDVGQRVLDLRTVYERLQQILGKNGRSHWFAEEMANLVDPAIYRSEPNEAWRRFRLRGRADRRFLGVLRTVAAWREAAAQTRDLPRGRIMKERGIEGGMGAVICISDEPVEEVLDAASEHGEIAVANQNAPGQIDLSGVVPELVFALEMSKTVGARKAVRLTVSVASHSPLMRRAHDEFGRILARVPFRDPQVPMLGNVHATVINTADGLRSELTEHLIHGVQWTASVRRMAAGGVTDFVEVGPGRVLSGLIRRINPEVVTHAVDLPDPRAWLNAFRETPA